MADSGGIRRGQLVYGSEGVTLGRVLECDARGFVVEKGLVFTEDYSLTYDVVAAANRDGVWLRVPASALVSDEDGEAWNPVRDPLGTAGGADLEALQAGMAEIDEKQDGDRRPRRPRAGPPAPPARGAGAPGQREEGPREARAGATIEMDGREIGRRIEEEIDDYERGAACAPRDGALVQPPADAELRVRGSRARSVVTAARTRRGALRKRREPAGATARGAGAEAAAAEAAPRARAGGRIDYRRAAPEAVAAMRRLEGYVRGCGLEARLLELVRLRASQLNGCAYCIDMHTQDARAAGETEQRLYLLEVWREAPFFTPRERAALAWTEAVTRLGMDHVSDEVYGVARAELGEKELVDLTMAIVAINGWNRLCVAFRAVPGSYRPGRR